MPTVTERLDAFTQFDRDYRDKRAVEIDDFDADSPPDGEPTYICSGCCYPVLATFATAEVVAGREDRHFCPRCLKAGALKGAA